MSGTTFEAGKSVIKKIDVTDFSKKNLVVVPDSFSMQAESLIFDCLNIKSTFNIEVVGISRLASKLLRQNNIPFSRISGIEEIFCIHKAVKENENNFKFFHKCGIDLCLKILQVIKQFKACHVTYEQIKTTEGLFLDEKMHDLKLIYQSYEKFLGEKLDLSKLLDFFLENVQEKLNLKNVNLFFANFDSFSPEINAFICKMAEYVNEIYIGMASPTSAGNAFIFEDDILKKTTKYAREYGKVVDVEKTPVSFAGERLVMLKNLFSFDVEKGKSDYFTNIIGKNADDEVEFVAKYIKYQIFHGARLKDFAVAIADESYYDKIKTIFPKFGLLSYCDTATDLSTTVIGKFVQKILQIGKFGFRKENLEYLVSCALLKNDEKEKILSEISYFDIQDEEEFLTREPEYKTIIFLINQLKKCKKIGDFVNILSEILKFTEENQQELLQNLNEECDYKKESENKQSYTLILQVLGKISELGEGEEVEYDDFERILLLALSSVKVETIPSYIDAVFVGEVTNSYFEDVDTLFVLGATADKLPKTQNDTAIIDDDDIKKLKLQFALEPEIKVLNRRNRLKLFECLFHAKKRLIVCQPIVVDGKMTQQAGFVKDLCEMFGKNVVQTESVCDFNIQDLTEEEKLDKFLFYLGSRKNLRDGISKISTNFAEIPQKKVLEIQNPKSKTKISASELESYFSCPFKRFVSYDLKIKPKENVQPNKRLFGIFEHALLQKFVEKFKENLGDLTEKQIDEFLNENVSSLAEKTYDKKVLKKSFVRILRNESKIIVKNVIFEQKNSKFRPIFLEEKIFVPISDDTNLIGFVDRIDKFEKYFRIFDYKTGKTDNIKKELYYGKKLQLFLYANAVQKKQKLECAGVYYFDCRTKYKKNNTSKNLLNGMTKKDNDVVLATDTRLWQEKFKSDLIGMSQKVSAKENEFAFKNGNAVENLQEYFEYSQQISQKAVKQIKEGYITPNPFAGECQFCPYVAICKHVESDGQREMQSIKEIKSQNKGKTDEN